MTLVKKTNGVNTNIAEVMRVENGVVTNISEIIQVNNGVLTTRFSGNGVTFRVNRDGIDDAGINFQVTKSGFVVLTISTGVFKGNNYNQGDELGTVENETPRTLTGFVTVPNDVKWSNAGQDVAIENFTVQQEGTNVVPPPEDRNRYSETFLDNVDPFEDVVDGEAEDVDCSTEEDYYLHVKSCLTKTTTSGHTPRFTTTCIAPDGCDLPDGSIIDHGPVETGSTEEQVCGDCIETFYRNPNYEGPIFDLQAIYDAGGYFSAYVNRDDGSVSTYLSGVVFAGVTTQLQVGQIDPFPVLPDGYTNSDGDPWEDRTVYLEVTGDIPTFYANEDEEINSADFRVSITARQRTANVNPPVLGVQVKYFNTDIKIITLTVNDGDDITLTDYRNGFSGYWFSTLTTRPLGTPVTFVPEGSIRPDRGFTDTISTGRLHSIVARNSAGIDSFLFRITTD